MHARTLLKSALLVAMTAFTSMGCAGNSDEEDLAALDMELGNSEVIEAGVELRITASRLNFRSGPSTNHRILDVLDNGTLVVTVARSGNNGWVNVRSPDGEVGWVNNKYVVRTSSSGSSSGGGTSGGSGSAGGATCSPSRGDGIVDRYQKALHDSIAFAEGTRNVAKDGYNVLYGYRTISSCQSHPNQCGGGSPCSTAAGRYQFLTKTWNGARSARNLSSFEPENQERAADYLIQNVRRVSLPQGRAMTATEFRNAMDKLSYEWSSLPPGRYGQPNKSHTQMRNMYCSLAGC